MSKAFDDIVAGTSRTVRAKFGMDVVGDVIEAANRQLELKRSRNQTENSLRQQTQAVKDIRMVGEQSNSKRLPVVKYRLHDAKYLSMDKFLHDMFFPLISFKDQFGIRSQSGPVNLDGRINPLNYATLPRVGELQLTGRHRGLAFLKFRHTTFGQDVNSAYVLSSNALDQGVINPDGNTHMTIKTPYRCMANGPLYASGSNGAAVVQPNCQNIAWNAAPSTTSGMAGMTGHEMGLNCADFEEAAAANMAYLPNPIPTVTNDGAQALIWNTPTSQIQANNQYCRNLQNAVFRIADGYIYLDISNAASTCCVVEIVINSMKKCDSGDDWQTFFNGVFNAVERYTKGSITGIPDAVLGNQAQQRGGWQAFYDPDYPLLKVPSSGKKFVEPYAREVHRSTHVLEPGQSKEVKIYLGALYYSLGSKYNLDLGTDLGTGIPVKRDNAGTLCVAIGHTGFDAFESAVTNGTNDTSIPVTNGVRNTGAFVGKSPTPSNIIIKGEYCEKFYPMTLPRPAGLLGPTGVMRPSFFNYQGNPFALPQQMIIAESVSTDDHNKHRPIGKTPSS